MNRKFTSEPAAAPARPAAIERPSLMDQAESGVGVRIRASQSTGPARSLANLRMTPTSVLPPVQAPSVAEQRRPVQLYGDGMQATTSSSQPDRSQPALPVGHRFSELAIQRPDGAPMPNKTGLPDRLKVGIERLSGMAMDDVMVHYNSARPAELRALAYTQGNEIHVGPGQEKHLAHEAWHVVQQKQGRVQATIQAKGLNINMNRALEAEADSMSARVEQARDTPPESPKGPQSQVAGCSAPVQLYIPPTDFLDYIERLRKKPDIKVNEQRLFHWNALGVFDEAAEESKEAVVAKMAIFNGISENVGGGELQPGQTHANEKLPAYLAYFSEFSYPLPHPLTGALHFAKRFDRMTEHGWISTNCPLPKGTLSATKDLAVHMIIAVQDNIADGIVVCNPHVTVRLKSAQDHLTIITMLNDQKAKTLEMKTLAKGAANSSISIGLNSDRKKEGVGAAETLGIDLSVLSIFTAEWITGVIAAAWQAAAQSAPSKAKKFVIK